MNLSVYTVTLGTRSKYLKKLRDFLYLNKPDSFEWIIGVQGCREDICIEENEFTKIIKWEENCGSGEANNRLLKYCSGNIVHKLDDDALPYGKDYFNHVFELMRITNYECILSPYPVGLINNPGGVLSKDHSVIYGEKTDTYYTLRKVHHIGGFARIMPGNIARKFNWPYDYSPITSGNEDGNFSNFCRDNNISMYYLENSIIVEHQESTLGQKQRYPNYAYSKI